MAALLKNSLPPSWRKGLIEAFTPDRQYGGYVVSGGMLNVSTAQGPAVSLSGNQHIYKRLSKAFNYPLTIVVVHRRTVNSPSRCLASVGAGANRHLLYLSSSTGVTMYSGGSGGGTQASGSSTGTEAVAVAAGRVFSSSLRDVFVNGFFSTVNTGTVITGTQNTFCIGGYWNNDAAASNFYSDEEVLFAGLWDRALTDQELLDINADWRQLTRQTPASIFIPEAAAGPTYATASGSSAFSVRNHASASASGYYTVRNHASGSKTAAWSVLAYVGSSGAGAWSVRGFASQSGAASYTVRNYASASASAAFSVLAAGLVSATASAAWTVRNHTTASGSAAASLRNFTSASSTSAFSVLASGLVTASRSAAWIVRNAVTASAPAAFSVRNYTSALQPGSWSVRSAVAATKSAAWSVTAYVFHTTGAAWSVDGDASTGWPSGRADHQHLAVVPFGGVRAMVPAAGVRVIVNFDGVRAIVQQDPP